MAWIISRKVRNAEVAPAPPEIDFALVLSRMITSVSTDPEHLRTTVYELARHKLDEQIASEDPEEKDRLADALEVAIQGVETHFSRLESRALAGPDGSRLSLPGPASGFGARPAPLGQQSDEADRGYQFARRKWEFTAPWRYLALLTLVAAVGLAIQQRVNLAAMLRHNVGPEVVVSKTASKPVQAASEPASPAQPDTAPAGGTSTVPTAFGVYAVSDGKLYTLEMLPGRAPDSRVAISAVISAPSKITLPDRHIKFIVFRRNSATNALERAEVRIIAKIAQAMKFDSAGKPVSTKIDDSGWVIRNISFPYRTAPLKGQPDMYEVLGEDADKPLEPGRYALVLKGEAYDFSVAGEIRDSRQCLESMAAANGAFYTECQKKR